MLTKQRLIRGVCIEPDHKYNKPDKPEINPVCPVLRHGYRRTCEVTFVGKGSEEDTIFPENSFVANTSNMSIIFKLR